MANGHEGLDGFSDMRDEAGYILGLDPSKEIDIGDNTDPRFFQPPRKPLTTAESADPARQERLRSLAEKVNSLAAEVISEL